MQPRTHLPDGQFPHARHARIARRANLSQVSALATSGKSKPSSRASRLDEEGRFGRSSRYVGRGCGGRCGHVRRTWRMRTAKSCGSGAPKQALRSRDVSCERRWQPSKGHRGERDISRKTIAQGMPVDCGLPVVTTVCFLPMHTGRGCVAHPAFPAPSVILGARSCITRADRAAGTRMHTLSAL